MSVTSNCSPKFGFVKKRPKGVRNGQTNHRYLAVILPKERETEIFVLIPSVGTELRAMCLEAGPKENPRTRPS